LCATIRTFVIVGLLQVFAHYRAESELDLDVLRKDEYYFANRHFDEFLLTGM